MERQAEGMKSNERPRVLVIGLDGFDIGFADRLMAKGALPALGALREAERPVPARPR